MSQTPETPAQPSPPDGSGAAPYVQTPGMVQKGDVRILVVVGLIAILVLIIFGASLWASGLLRFPSVELLSGEARDYLNDSLVYRERRMVVSLLMRTFLTGFSFVVGLALCTMGGLFILRQVVSLTSLSGGIGSGPAGAVADAAEGERITEWLRRTQFSFSSYSPGVLFMLGGVAIMVVTQWLAIPVRAVEIVPPGALALCEDPATGNLVTCDDRQIGAQIASNTALPITATSEAVVATEEQVPPPPGRYIDLLALPGVTLPEGHEIVGVTGGEIFVQGPAFVTIVSTEDLDFDAQDWGLTAKLGP